MKPLSTHLHEYLVLRRSLGYSLVRSEHNLKRFLEFLSDKKSSIITSELAVQWSTHFGTTSRANGAKRLSQVRQFAQHVFLEDSRHEVPPRYLIQHKSRRHIPYIYTEANILQLMDATENLGGTLKSCTYRTLFGLLFCTGMRVGEAVDLNQSDFNANKKVLIIRNSKWGKSRKVFLHPSTVQELKKYINKRDALCERGNDAFFLSNTGTRLFPQNVHKAFQKCLRWSELYDVKPRPRIHDMRHSFVINTIKRWYQEEQPIEPKLPSLSTYVGHVSPSSTYWYLSAVPELMTCVSKRMETQL